MHAQTLKRLELFLADYHQWISIRKFPCIEIIKQWYERGFDRGFGDEIDLVNTETYANIVLYEMPTEADDFRFLADYLRDLIIEEGYTLYSSDNRPAPHPNAKMHFIERHYLKPAFVKEGDNYVLPVLYGNIALETFIADGQPYLLKITCTYYSERNRQKDKSVHELMATLLRN